MPIEPLLSVIIPAYNPGEQVRITVEALVAQQVRKPVEVIVVDDGSEPAIDIDLANLPATIRFNIKSCSKHGPRRSMQRGNTK